MNYTIILKNNISQESYTYNLEEVGDSALYYHFQDLEIDIPDGEYTYTLYGESEEILGEGLCRVGNVETQRNIEYNNERTYKQYE